MSGNADSNHEQVNNTAATSAIARRALHDRKAHQILTIGSIGWMYECGNVEMPRVAVNRDE